MKARAYIAALVGLSVAGTAALAQETPPPAQTNTTDIIGPPQLRDFSLNGTVTRPAPQENPPAQPVQRPPAQRPTPQASAQQQPAPERQARPQAATPGEPQQSERGAAVEQPSADEGSLPAIALPDPSAEATGEAPESVFEPASSTSGNGFSMIAWIAAAIALGAAAAWFLYRRRSQASLAGAGQVDLFDAPPKPEPQRPPKAAPKPAPAPAPAPGPVPSPPEPAAGEAPAAGGAVVSTRLRPWLEIAFVPERAIIDEEKAAITFELTVLNSGSVPARDVLVEAGMFNAGPMQDQQIQQFFSKPMSEGSRIPAIGPLQRVTVTTTVGLPRAQIQPLEIEGRPLLVPLIAFNAIYSWSSGSGQSSVSHLVGKRTKGEKLAPFRLDLGPKVFRNLSSREHELRIRR